MERDSWRVSSYSGANNNCVEVSLGLGDVVGVRDTKDRLAGNITVDAHAWAVFLSELGR